MSYEIIKSVPADFPALTQPGPDGPVLMAQINAAISTAECVSIINNHPDYTVQFDVEPSAGDLTLVDSVCAAHTGVPFATGVQKLFAEAVMTETGNSYVEKASLQSAPLSAGDYLVNWYSEIAVLLADATSGVQARVMWGGVERAESSHNLSFYQAFGGSVIVTIADLEAPELSIELRRVGTPNTAQLRRVRMAIAPI